MHNGDLVAEFLAVDSITISQQISWCGVERKGFPHLLRRPFRGGVSCDVKVDDTSTVMRENDKDEKDFEAKRMNREKID